MEKKCEYRTHFSTFFVQTRKAEAFIWEGVRVYNYVEVYGEVLSTTSASIRKIRPPDT